MLLISFLFLLSDQSRNTQPSAAQLEVAAEITLKVWNITIWYWLQEKRFTRERERGSGIVENSSLVYTYWTN